MTVELPGIVRERAPDDVQDDRALLREDADRVEALLDELQGLVGPLAWGRVEELVERIVRFHGAGLERVLAIAAGVVEPKDGTFEKSLADDEVVSSLLLLHGLHPLPTRDRVERALEEVRPYLSSHAGGVELQRIDETGVAHLRLLGSCRGCPSSRVTIEDAIERAIEEAAPEIVRVEVEEGEDRPENDLVRIGKRSGRRKRWVSLDGLSDQPDGWLQGLVVEGAPLLLLRVDGALLAYENACGGCGARMEGAALEGAWLCCGGCGARFDVTRAGRSLEGKHLSPVPLLLEESGARVAVTEAKR